MRGPLARVTLLTQADCASCEHAKQVLDRVGNDFLLEVTEISLDTDAGRDLAAGNGVLFAPGILLDGEGFSFGRLSERRLRKQLSRRPIQDPDKQAGAADEPGPGADAGRSDPPPRTIRS